MRMILIANGPADGWSKELKTRLAAALEGVDVDLEIVDCNNAGIEIGTTIVSGDALETDLLDCILRSITDPRSDIVMRTVVDEPIINLPQLQRHALNDLDFGHISRFSMRAYRATHGQVKRLSQRARR